MADRAIELFTDAIRRFADRVDGIADDQWTDPDALHRVGRRARR